MFAGTHYGCPTTGEVQGIISKVTGDVVATILDGVLNNFLPSEFALAQYRNPLHQPWFNVPFFDDCPSLNINIDCCWRIAD